MDFSKKIKPHFAGGLVGRGLFPKSAAGSVPHCLRKRHIVGWGLSPH